MMTLPPLTIPSFPLPFEIPQMIHPLLAHFAIVLPVVVLMLELINLFAKKRTIGVLSFFFMVVISVVFLAAYLTGGTDGKMAKEFLSPEAKDALMAHKQLGIYLVYSSGILMLFKLFSVLIRKTAIKVLFFLVLIVFTIALFNEGHKGSGLVYQYGVNVKSVPAIGKPAEPTVAPEPKSETPVVVTEDKKAEASKAETHEATAETPVHEGNVTQISK
jgi:uncharacterized membrane protein